MSVLETMEKSRIVVIVRGTYGENLLNLAKAMYAGGMRFMEVTFAQDDPNCITKTSDAISSLIESLPCDMHFGAGTVLNKNQVKAAYDAGAKFIISPNVNQKVISLTKELGMASIPGAMTPSEILQAHEYGADIVKIFPLSDLGLSYIKSIRAPISHVKMMATGGVREENFTEIIRAGFVGAGISGRLTDKKLIAAGDFSELEKRARVFSDLARELA